MHSLQKINENAFSLPSVPVQWMIPLNSVTGIKMEAGDFFFTLLNLFTKSVSLAVLSIHSSGNMAFSALMFTLTESVFTLTLFSASRSGIHPVH